MSLNIRLPHELAELITSLGEPELEAVRNACSVRLLQMRRTDLPLPQLLELLATITPTLEDQGKRYHGLDSWEWRDGAIRFWLNPVEQDLYNAGWFSIDELIAWTMNQGPIMIQVELEDEDEPDLHAEIEWLPRGREDTVLV